MMRDELAVRLLNTFLEELEEQVAVLNAELLKLERGGASAGMKPLDAIFRVAHTLKGAARATRLGPIEELCHAMEGPLAAAKAGGREPGAEDIQLLFAAADALGAAGDRLRRGQDVDAAALGALSRRITAVAGRNRSVNALTTPAFGAGLAAELRGLGDTSEGVSTAGEAAPLTGGPASSASEPAPLTSEPAPLTSEPAPLTSEPASATGETAPSVPNARASGDITTGASGTGPAETQPTADEADHVSDSVVVRSETQVRIRAEKLDELLATAGEVMLAGGTASAVAAPSSDLAYRAQRVASSARRASSRLRKLLQSAGAPEDERRLLTELAEETAAIARDAHLVSLQSTRAAGAVARASDELLESVRRLRLRPFEEAVEALPRVVRDLAAETGRQVTLRISGGGVEADRAVLDGLREAVLHLVRNAVDHGIEPPDERELAGKPAAGTVTLAASLHGQHRLRVVVKDDGRGIDLDAAAELARRRGRTVPHDPSALIQLLFESGMSTRASTTEISGRGVGLDVVRTIVMRLRGAIDVQSVPGEGTSFILETPLTIATQKVVLVSVSGQLFAIPSVHVEGLRILHADDLRQVESRTVLPGPEGAIPVAALASMLGPPLATYEREGRLPAVVVMHNEARGVVLVDELLEETEVVVRPLDIPVDSASQSLAGVALLPSGRIVLVLSAASLLQRASVAEPAVRMRSEPSRQAPRVLVVDDSITTRTLEASILEAAGYSVTTAVDGRAAWSVLHERGADLVLSDVQMPHVDGYQLCEMIRSSPKFASLPVILVTSLESPQQRQRGLEAGADAYIVKSSFDQQELLETVRQLVGREGAP